MRRVLLFSFVLMSLTGVARPQSSANQIRASDLPQYDLKIKVLPDAHRLEGSGTIKLPPVNNIRETVPIALSELMSDVSFEVVAPRVSAGPVKLERKERPFARPGWATVVWTINPAQPFPAGEPIVLRFSYAGGGDRTGFGFYIGPVCSFGVGLLTAWYPVLEDEPKVQLRGFRGTGNIQFKVPPGFTTHAVGKLLSTRTETEQGDFRYRIDTPSTLSFALAKYLVARRDGAIPVSIHLLQPRPNVGEYLARTAQVLAALVKEFGPYPYPDFAILEVPADINAGFSGVNADGFILTIGETLDGSFKTAHYAHEISHSWWGAIVQRKGTRGYYMLDEAMAQYGSLRAVETIEGPAAAERYRRTGYPGFSEEYCAFTYLMRSATGFDHTLADLPLDTQFMNMRVADSKGMLVWDLLSRTVGRKLFSKILTDIIRQYAFRRVAWEDFLMAIQEGSGRDLSWFYEQWFQRTGAPDWQLTWTREGKNVRGLVTQAAPFYRAQVKIELKSGRQTLTRTLNIEGARTEFSWPVNFRVKTVTLDPHFEVLHWTPEYRERAMLLGAYTKGDIKFWRGQNEEAIREFQAGLEQVSAPDHYGLRFLFEYGIARALTSQDKFADAKEHIQAALASPVKRKDVLPWAYVQQATIALRMNDEVTFQKAIKAAIIADAKAGGTGAADQVVTLKRMKSEKP
ncbi:MAG TPA: M1 family aminopeptidase [Pyrinomonadaceae bacterium]|nr:M1 family aminopeptidase [Pyrinomonadaceae bacterium]